MGNMTVEQKLEMIRRARESSASNSNALRGRQKIMGSVTNTEEQDSGKISFFKVKIFVVIILFAGFLVLDVTGVSFFNLKAETIIKAITDSLEIEKLSLF